jgi:excisionase family DNA binding protein
MRLLTVRHAAELLTVSTRKAYNLVTVGKLPCYRIDNVIRIAEEDVEDYLADCRVAPQPVVQEQVEELLVPN